VLLKGGAGQFGSLPASAATPASGKVLLVQCRVVNDRGGVVYSADVLLPDQPSFEVKLPEAGRLADQPAALAIMAENGQASVGLTIDDAQRPPAGVAGQAPIGVEREVGRFRLHEQNLRMYVRTQRLSDFNS
jgi:hypothetical protein